MKRHHVAKYCILILSLSLALPNPADGFFGDKRRKRKERKNSPTARYDKETVRIPILISPRAERTIPKGSRVAIFGISGEDSQCAQLVEDAIQQELIDNVNYSVVTRAHIGTLIKSQDRNWNGNFDKRTISRVGRLTGASAYIVGIVGHCSNPEAQLQKYISDQQAALAQQGGNGSSEITSLPSFVGSLINSIATFLGLPARFPKGRIFNLNKAFTLSTQVFVSLEVLDTETGKILMSGTFEGAYDNQIKPNAGHSINPGLAIYLAAKDAALQFSNKIFSRANIQRITMFGGEDMGLSTSIKYARFGHCERAVHHLNEQFGRTIYDMSEVQLGKFMHNMGAALMCSNRLPDAYEKLLGSYRLIERTETRRLIDLCSQLIDTGLAVSRNDEHEIKMKIIVDEAKREASDSNNALTSDLPEQP